MSRVPSKRAASAPKPASPPLVSAPSSRSAIEREETASEDWSVFGDEIDSKSFDVDLSPSSVFELFAANWLVQQQSRRSNTSMRRTGGESPFNKLKEGIRARGEQLTQKLENNMKSPPFIQWMDKLTFVFGVLLLVGIQYLMLRKPTWMHHAYATLIVALMIWRYVQYHALKYHYFMLDFCYYVQLLSLYYIYVRPDPTLFQVVFVLCNGPLATAIIMWHNSLVFHDWDKMTSVCIHLLRALVTFARRWLAPFEGSGAVDSVLTWRSLIAALMLYIFWQVVYLIKTEWLDHEKLSSDPDLMTSLKWMTIHKPHPIYRAIKKRGYNPKPVTVIVICQLIYTALTFTPMMFIYGNELAHTLYLVFIFVVCTFNGASFYFEAFAEQYVRRLKQAAEGARPPSSYSTSTRSLLLFAAFFAGALISMYFSVEFCILWAKN